MTSDRSLDGTVWAASGLIPRSPDIRFFYCDPRRPKTPSHVWWDGMAFAIDEDLYRRQANMEIDPHGYMRFSMGKLEVIADESHALTLEQLEAWQAKAQEEAGR